MTTTLDSIALLSLSVWNALFLGVVGAMKFSGKLRHPLSHLAGGLEMSGSILFGASLLRRHMGKKKLDDVAETGDNLDVIGCFFNVLALGVITSTPKRKSPVCWGHLFLNVYYCWKTGKGVGGAVAFAIMGHAIGAYLMAQGKDYAWL